MQVNQRDGRPEVLRDHFDECFEHFIRAFNVAFPPMARHRLKSAAMPIVEFCDVDTATVGVWLTPNPSRKTNIVGLSRLKLYCFLDLQGYRIIEFERLSATFRNLAEIIGYGIESPDNVASEIGFAHTSEIYAAMRGDRGVSQDREEKMWSYWKSRRELLEQKKKDAQRKFVIEFPGQIQVEEQSVAKVIRMPESQSQIAVRRRATLQIMEGLVLLLDEGVLESLNEKELQELDSAAQMCITKLSAHMSVLNMRLITGKKV